MGSQPDHRWVEWAEAECVRRLTIALAEIKARKEREAAENVERSFSAWEPEAPAGLRVIPAPAPAERVIKVHVENLSSA